MVEAAKQCASNPSDPESQQTLKTAAENLRSTTHAAVGTTIKRKMIKRLENASKHAAATATQCIAASQGAGGHNTNGMSQDELMESCKAVADVIPRLVLVLIFLGTNILFPESFNQFRNDKSEFLTNYRGVSGRWAGWAIARPDFGSLFFIDSKVGF